MSHLLPRRLWLPLVLVLACGLGCEAQDRSSALGPNDIDELGKADGHGGKRDWTKHPAIAVRPAADVVYALSDIHGGYKRLVHLLVANGILVEEPATPAEAEWGAGPSTLVITGDLIDKSDGSVAVIDLVRALEKQAKASGGEVITTLGNHEAEFLADPLNNKADSPDGIDAELEELGIDPFDFASVKDPHGLWLRRLPFGARVGRWFFCHSGDTQNLSLSGLRHELQHALDEHGWDAKDIIGKASILESRDWFEADGDTAWTQAQAIGADHIVFGHDPNALGPKGSIAVGPDAVLFRIDTGMSPGVDDSHGFLLRVSRDGDQELVEALDRDGLAEELWSGPAGE